MPAEGSILAYWSPRKETVEACAGRLAQTLQHLRQISPIFSSWSDVKRKERFVEIKPDVSLLAQLLNAGRNKTDFAPKKIIEKLGFSTWIRTADRAREYLVFQVHCGAYCEDVPNRCIIDFPEAGPHSYKTVEAALKVKALRTLIANWNPDRGAICNWSFHLSMEAKEPKVLFGDLGWVTYVPNSRGELPEEVRRRFHIEEVPSFGNLIYLTEEPPRDETNPDYLNAAIELYQTLERHGIYHKFSHGSLAP